MQISELRHLQRSCRTQGNKFNLLGQYCGLQDTGRARGKAITKLGENGASNVTTKLLHVDKDLQATQTISSAKNNCVLQLI